VNTTAARYQNLSINQTKLSGQCGRLKCCLNYELDTYLDALQNFPENADSLQVAKGTAILIKKDIFRNLMWYILPDSSKQYPLTIERVKKIKFENSKNIVPQDLEPVDVTSNKQKDVEPEYVDLVGQISLRTLEKAEKRKRSNNPQQSNNNNNNRRDNNRPPQRPGQGGDRRQPPPKKN
jgi:cell fate regulator YaaT (PSP1 superfamily)